MRELRWLLGAEEISCRIDQSKDHAVFQISGTELPFRLLGPSLIEIAGQRHRFHVIHNGESATVWLDGHIYRLQRAAKSNDVPASASTGSAEIRALMPGKLLQLAVGVGDTVREKQTVGMMESMKMESPLVASASGRVAEIRFKPGDVLDMGATVMVIEPLPAATL